MIGTLKNRLYDFVSKGNIKKYLGSAGWLLGNKLISLFTSVFIGIWLARYLGPNDFGLFNYVQSFVGLFTIFAGLGLDGIMEREILKSKSASHVILGTSFILKILASVVVMTFVLLAIYPLSMGPENKTMALIVCSTSFFQAFNVINYEFTTQIKGKFIALSQTVSLVLISIFKVWFILIDKPLIYFIWLILLESVIVAVFLVFFYVKNVSSLNKWSFDLNVAKKLLTDSWPLILTGFVITLYMKIDQVMIKEYLGNQEVGIYAVAARLSELWYFIPAVVADSFFPAILNVQENLNLFKSRLKNLYSLMFFMALTIALLMTLISDWLILLLYDTPYLAASNVLKIHIWSGIFVFIGYVFNKFLIAKNWTKIAFQRAFYGALINILLNLYLIPKTGIIGAAIATLLSQAISNYFFDLTNKKLWHQFKLKSYSFIQLPKNIK